MSGGVYRGGAFRREPVEVPLREERFGAETSPATLAEQLTRVQTATKQATEATRANRSNQAVVFEDVACGMGGTELVLRHGLGRRARWRVVDWARVTPGGGYELERSTTGNDENTLTLRSYVLGTATIEVE